MYCPTCGNETTVELKYCNRCGANLALPPSSLPIVTTVPVSLTVPTIVIGLTIIFGLGIILSSIARLAEMHVHPAFLTWMVLFSMLTLFGCSAMLIRFWSKMVGVQRQTRASEQNSGMLLKELRRNNCHLALTQFRVLPNIQRVLSLPRIVSHPNVAHSK